MSVPDEMELVTPDVAPPAALSMTTTLCTVGPETVIELAPVVSVILFPPTKLTLEEVPFKLKFVAAGTVGPTMDMLLTPVFRVMFAPAASTIVPVLVARPVPNAAT